MYHQLSINEVLSELETSFKGLTTLEAETRNKKYGPNQLKGTKRKTLLKMIKNQIFDIMVIILFVAAVLSFVFKDVLEGMVILFIIFVDTVIGVIQENKAEKAIESLKKLAPSETLVLRDGKKIKILVSEVVVGDIVFIEEGDLIPADMRIIDDYGLRITEASLTGESLAVNKNCKHILSEETPLAERENMAYSSSLVTYGHGIGVVTKIGMDTEVGHIAHMLNTTQSYDTPIKQKLNAVGKTLSVIGIIICLLIFAIGLMYEKPWQPLLMTAIALAISIIPEGLPATATIVLALGVERMVKKQALIRKLPAVETLGNTSVICSDKTGTLTRNEMKVTAIMDMASIMPMRSKEVRIYAKKEIVMACALCNNVKVQENIFIGDPTEIALAKLVGENYENLNLQFPRIHEIAFDSMRKRMTSLNSVHGLNVVYVKGAVEEILKNCNFILDGENIRVLNDIDRLEIIGAVNKFAEQACRVMTFAKKEVKENWDDELLETDMTFLGLVAMIDPPRLEVKSAIEITKKAGIRMVIITGDHALTAAMVAKEIGIYENEPVNGQELMNLDDEQLCSLVKKRNIFARVSPYDKLRIVKAYKSNGDVVAMTGDGVNDAPSLKAADIGIAMGKSGTDVAKDASDMILLDDNFDSIVEAIFEGRRVYKNIQKVIQFLLSGNVGEILTLFIATILNFKFMPLLAIHILWVNLATDTLPALALGVDPVSKEILEEKPRKNASLFEKRLIYRVLFHGVLIASATLLIYFIGFRHEMLKGNNEIFANQVAQTMAFATLALAQLMHAFSQRSNVQSIFVRNSAHNKYLWGAIVLSLVLLATILLVPSCQILFGFAFLTLLEWWIVILCSFIPLVGVEMSKLTIRIYRKRRHKKT